MRKSSIFLTISLAVSAALFSSCSGLAVWNMGKYFKTELAPDADKRDISTVGVYVFSDGAAIDAGNEHFVGFDKSWWPKEIHTSSVFEPDTANSGPSLELGTAISQELEDRGYKAKVIGDLGHSGEVSVEQVLKHAKEKGLDAVFIAHYSGVSSWTEYAGETYGYRVVITNYNVVEGYIYIPNAMFYDLKRNDVVWKNSYYGLTEKAHSPNIVGDPFNELASDAVKNTADETYLKAAPKAAKSIFSPALWPKSFKAFPVKEGFTPSQGKKRL